MLNLIGFGAVAGLIPVYLGIAAALLLGRVLPRSWEGGLIGVATGVLVYLFFDLMHEAVELTGVRDVLSWGVFLASLGISLVGLVALEIESDSWRSSSEPAPVSPLHDCDRDGFSQSRGGIGDRGELCKWRMGSQHAFGDGLWVAQRHGRVRHCRCRRENTGEVDGRVSPRVTSRRSDVRGDAVERAGPFTLRVHLLLTLAAGSLLYVILSPHVDLLHCDSACTSGSRYLRRYQV